MTPPELIGLLQACKADSANDERRLILADWLEEHGEEARALLIRRQCRQHLGASAPTEGDLLRSHQQRWLEALPALSQKTGIPCAWKVLRGLIWLDMEAWAWQNDQERILAEIDEDPWLEGLQFRWRRQDEVDRLLREPIGPFAALHLCFSPADAAQYRTGGLRPEGARVVAAAPHLARLRTLNLGHNWIGAAGVQSLVESPHLGSLTTLLLPLNGIGARGARALATAPHLAGLITLDLGNNQLGDQGMADLAASTSLAHLTFLALGSNQLGDQGARTLASSPSLARLTTLDLSSNQIGNEGAAALASSPYLTRLSTLNLRGNWIEDKGARALAHSPSLDQINRLDLSANGINKATKVLRQRFGDRVRLT